MDNKLKLKTNQHTKTNMHMSSLNLLGKKGFVILNFYFFYHSSVFNKTDHINLTKTEHTQIHTVSKVYE